MSRAKRKSDVGTAMARLNEFKFGLASDAPIIPGVESPQDWTQRYEALIADYAPVGGLEETLVERAATLSWRLRRVARYESGYSAASIERVPEDFIRRALPRYLPRTIKEADDRVETAERGLQLLEVLGAVSPLAEILDEDVEAIFEALADDPEISELLADSIPGFEEGIVNADDWTPMLLRTAFREIARRAEMEPTEVLHRAITKLSAYGDVRIEERAAMLAEQDRMRRERLLPESSTLHAITRYESSLHRQWVQVMHELEAAQARRRGHATPLIRADIQLVAAK